MTRETTQAGLKEKSRDLVKKIELPQHEELTVDFISPERHGSPVSLAFYNGLKALLFHCSHCSQHNVVAP